MVIACSLHLVCKPQTSGFLQGSWIWSVLLSSKERYCSLMLIYHLAATWKETERKEWSEIAISVESGTLVLIKLIHLEFWYILCTKASLDQWSFTCSLQSQQYDCRGHSFSFTVRFFFSSVLQVPIQMLPHAQKQHILFLSCISCVSIISIDRHWALKVGSKSSLMLHPLCYLPKYFIIHWTMRWIHQWIDGQINKHIDIQVTGSSDM